MAVSLLILSLHAVHAQSGKEGLSFDSTLWDFGTVREDARPVMHTFSFRNHGTSAVRLERVSVSCSCLKVYLGETGIDPGETGEFSVSFSPAGLDGPQEKSITVFTEGSRYILDVRGTVANSRVDDSYSTDLGSGIKARAVDLDYGVVYAGERFLRAVHVWNTSKEDRVISASGVPAYLTVIGDGVVRAGERKEIDLVLEIPVGEPRYGTLTGGLKLAVDGRPAARQVSVRARCVERTPRNAASRPRMEISSRSLELRRFFWQDRASGSLTLSNTGNSELRIRKVELSGGLTCSLSSGSSIPAGGHLKVEVGMAGEAGTIVLFTNDPVRPFLEIECTRH